MSTTARIGGGVLVASLLLLAGCGSESSGSLQGECNARIVFQNKTFRGHNLVRQSAPAEAAVLGTGDVVGCDREVVDHAAIHKLRGVDADVAIAVVDSHWPGVYVREGSEPTDWPAQLKLPSP
ncbi:hypothetical protein [Flexivirga alba]|uniref:Lipoprotein n=1 Tax=Flexivirga alba TaxID=702742 RepID=A0ABW2ACI1_9MICO